MKKAISRLNYMLEIFKVAASEEELIEEYRGLLEQGTKSSINRAKKLLDNIRREKDSSIRFFGDIEKEMSSLWMELHRAQVEMQKREAEEKAQQELETAPEPEPELEPLGKPRRRRVVTPGDKRMKSEPVRVQPEKREKKEQKDPDFEAEEYFLTAPFAKNIANHPDYDLIVSRLKSGDSPGEVARYLAEKYKEEPIEERKTLVISEQSLKEFLKGFLRVRKDEEQVNVKALYDRGKALQFDLKSLLSRKRNLVFEERKSPPGPKQKELEDDKKKWYYVKLPKSPYTNVKGVYILANKNRFDEARNVMYEIAKVKNNLISIKQFLTRDVSSSVLPALKDSPEAEVVDEKTEPALKWFRRRTPGRR